MTDITDFRARIFKTLGDPLRLQILQLLRDGEKCVCELVPQLGVSQPVVSRHLKILKGCGLVQDRKEGNKRFYSVTNPKIFNVIDSITPELKNILSKIIIEQII